MPDAGGTSNESIEALKERVRTIGSAVSELKERVKEIERGMRSMASNDIDQIRKSLYSVENHIANFKATHDDNKQTWTMVLNFLFQFIWVILAAYVLTKLGLDMGPT